MPPHAAGTALVFVDAHIDAEPRSLIDQSAFRTLGTSEQVLSQAAPSLGISNVPCRKSEWKVTEKMQAHRAQNAAQRSLTDHQVQGRRGQGAVVDAYHKS